MFAELFHRFLFPTLVAVVVGTVWIVGWSQALVREADQGWWPAIPLPSHSARMSDSQNAIPQQNARSLDQVFFKDDQIIRVR
jgi:hypothetical protein